MKIIFIILAIFYTTGYFLGTVDFDPGAETQQSAQQKMRMYNSLNEPM